MRDTPEDALINLLERERAMIRAGDLVALSDLSARKMQLVQALSPAYSNQPAFVRIDGALRQNARLLTAACEGIKSAQSRLHALRAVRDGFSLYTANGDRTTVARRSEALEHKA